MLVNNLQRMVKTVASISLEHGSHILIGKDICNILRNSPVKINDDTVKIKSKLQHVAVANSRVPLAKSVGLQFSKGPKWASCTSTGASDIGAE